MSHYQIVAGVAQPTNIRLFSPFRLSPAVDKRTRISYTQPKPSILFGVNYFQVYWVIYSFIFVSYLRRGTSSYFVRDIYLGIFEIFSRRTV